MRVSCKQPIRIASTLVLLGLAQAGFAAGDRMKAGERLFAMNDDMKARQPDSMGSGSNNMSQPDGQPQQTGRDRMDDKMRPPQSAPMLDHGKEGQPHDHDEMLMRMEKMMRGQIGGVTKTKADALAEERIAFLKAELQITDKQTAEWNALAEALRSARHHLAEARKIAVLDDNTPSAGRLEHYELHLTERLEAVKSARAGFTRLYQTLDDVQKQTADAILVPLIATF